MKILFTSFSILVICDSVLGYHHQHINCFSRECNNSLAQVLSFRERRRPGFSLEADKDSSTFLELQTGGCESFEPTRWHNRSSLVVRHYGDIITLFSDVDCTGNISDVPLNEFMYVKYSRKLYVGSAVKSARLLSDLKFQSPCESCPKFLYKGSREYEFWTCLLSIYSDTYQKMFEERVNRSTDGFISWDFFFPPNTSAEYSDALRSQISLFNFLTTSEVGQLDFTVDQIIHLQKLTSEVKRERDVQLEKYPLDDYNRYLLKFAKNTWEEMDAKLKEIRSNWVVGRVSSLENNYVERSNYSAIVYSKQRRGSKLVLKYGECRTLSTGWHNRVDLISTEGHCFVLFEGVDCKGPSHWAITLNNIRDQNVRGSLKRNDGATKSLKVCDLSISSGCVWCPQLLRYGSTEYEFWMFFFLFYSHSYRKDFRERVERSNSNGFILWDFLSGSNANQSLSGQYRYAIDHLFHVLRSIQAGRPGMWNFNTENTETLRGLASFVHAERQKQGEEVNEKWSDADIATMEQLISVWDSVRVILAQILKNWDPDSVIDEICGLVDNNRPARLQATEPLIFGGEMAVYGDDPWHAAIYAKFSKIHQPLLICGATLISSTILVSAAHCFYNEILQKAMNETSDYEIVVGKFTRNYGTKDGPSQSSHEIKELLFHKNGFDPVLTGNYGSDIILIVLKTPVKFNSYVRPACMDWDNSIFGSSIHDNSKGRLVGWGVTINGSTHSLADTSKYLLTADLPFISFSDCKGKVLSLSNDKFCAGSERGAGARSGDSGGGLMFKHKGRFYLRGLVSTRDRYNNNSIVTFTDMALYTSWIRNYV